VKIKTGSLSNAACTDMASFASMLLLLFLYDRMANCFVPKYDSLNDAFNINEFISFSLTTGCYRFAAVEIFKKRQIFTIRMRASPTINTSLISLLT